MAKIYVFSIVCMFLFVTEISAAASSETFRFNARDNGSKDYGEGYQTCDDVCTQIAEMPKETRKQVTTVDFCQSPITTQGATQILEALTAFTSLQTVDLQRTQIRRCTDSFIGALQAVLNMSSVKTVSLLNTDLCADVTAYAAMRADLSDYHQSKLATLS